MEGKLVISPQRITFFGPGIEVGDGEDGAVLFLPLPSLFNFRPPPPRIARSINTLPMATENGGEFVLSVYAMGSVVIYQKDLKGPTEFEQLFLNPNSQTLRITVTGYTDRARERKVFESYFNLPNLVAFILSFSLPIWDSFFGSSQNNWVRIEEIGKINMTTLYIFQDTFLTVTFSITSISERFRSPRFILTMRLVPQ